MRAKHLKYYLGPDAMDDIVDEISKGAKSSDLCDKYSITQYYFFKSFEKEPLFQKKLDEARKYAAICEIEALNDDLDQVITPTDAAVAKLRADNRKWTAAKHARDIYGEKMEVSVHQTLDISRVLGAANQRIGPVLDQTTTAIDVTPVESTTCETHATGSKPVESVEAPKKGGSFDDLL